MELLDVITNFLVEIYYIDTVVTILARNKNVFKIM